MAFAKSQIAAGAELPTEGAVFISVHDFHKARIVPVARVFAGLGFEILATTGTAAYLNAHGVDVQTVLKVSEGMANVVDNIKNGRIQLIINASIGRKSHGRCVFTLRQSRHQVTTIPYSTTIAAFPCRRRGHQGAPVATDCR
jgi:carbamoyl-phosphate synthase large subunit